VPEQTAKRLPGPRGGHHGGVTFDRSGTSRGKGYRMRTLLIACCAAVLCGAVAWSEDVTITREQVPPAVLAVMVKAAAPAALSEFVRGIENGATVYSAEFTPAGGKLMEVTVGADATLIAVEAEAEEPAKEAGAAPPAAPGPAPTDKAGAGGH